MGARNYTFNPSIPKPNPPKLSPNSFLISAPRIAAFRRIEQQQNRACFSSRQLSLSSPLQFTLHSVGNSKRSFQMALRGVWQLQKLIVSYCDWGGSSRGIRAFMELHLPSFKERNPQPDVVTELIRGQHPHLKALYRNKNERVVCVKNLQPEEILQHATRLRNALGRKVVKLKTRHVTKHPSVQGTWTTAVKF